jgi:hypothetical protein
MTKDTTKRRRKVPRVAGKMYDERYVAFVDILAFTNIVERSVSEPSLVSSLSEALNGISRSAANARSTALSMEATAFSDTVVLSVPVSADGLLYMLQTIEGLSVDLLSLNMLFRGALVKGKLIHTTEVIFGPALLNAYGLESTTSFHPRIMVSSDVYADAASVAYKSQDLVPRYIVAEQHDVPYLNIFARWHDLKGAWPEDALQKLVKLQTIIATGLIENSGRPPISEKYKWIARKLNRFVRTARLQSKIAIIELGDTDEG